MPDMIARIAAGCLALVFAWSVLAKVVRYNDWRAALARYRLGPFTTLAAFGAPLAEGAVVAGIVAGRTQAAGAAIVALLSAFSLAIVRARSFEGNRLPCGCFGKTKERDFRLVLVRNGVLGLLAAGILLHGEDIGVFAEMGGPGPSEIVPAILTALAVVIAVSIGLSVARSFKKGSS